MHSEALLCSLFNKSTVLAASLPEVERWLDNILDAQRIEDVFV